MIFLRIEFGSILNVFGSISAKIGIQFQCKTAIAVAVIVQVGTIISSPGSKSIAPTAAINPDVHELKVIANSTP